MANSTTISFYAGDVVEVWFRLNEVDRAAVKEVCVSAFDLRICIHLAYSEARDAYCLRLESEQTAKLCEGTFYYDLTAELIDGNKLTLTSDGLLKISKKRNKLCGG